MAPQIRGLLNQRRLSEVERAALERFHAGERDESFQVLIRPLLGSLQALARRVAGEHHAADDLIQETLVRAFRGLERFRGDSALRTWLFRILLRLASEPRRWRRGSGAEPLDIEIPDGLGPDPGSGMLERELRDRLAEAVERLTPRQRAAFHLRAVEGLDYAAVAEALECSVPAARMLVLGARRKVIERIGRSFEP